MESTTAEAVGTLIPKLQALLQQEYKLRKGVKQDIEFLVKELDMVRRVALDGQEKLEHRPADDFWRKLREVSYDVEDSLDDFMFRAGPHPGFTPLGLINKYKGLLAEVTTRHRIAKQIDNLKVEAKELYGWCERYNRTTSNSHFPAEGSESAHRSSSGIVENPGSSTVHADASTLVGMERPLEDMMHMLQLTKKTDDSGPAARLQVVSIVGSPGMGRTALARTVYNRIQQGEFKFPYRAWVSVLRNHTTKNILMEILCQVEEDPRGCWAADCSDEWVLITRIKEFLQGKRYLLVLDDIWSIKTWEVIKLALPLDSCGSRVITTTRIKSVAHSCSSDWNGHVYQVIPLSWEDSWMLFRREFISSFPSHLEDVADKILERCSGVPLAIITMSRLLSMNPRRDMITYISASPGVFTEELLNILLLSYNDLPHRLKVCFLYLSIFPEGYLINYDGIIRCWIAEGFISENDLEQEGNPNRNLEVGGDPNKKTLEKTGESYLNELIDRSLIQPIPVSQDGKPKFFRIHSLMLDLIKHISTNHKFITLFTNEEPPSALHGKIRRLSVFNVNKDHYIPASVDISHIRSLHIFSSVGMKIAFKHLSFLRVLHLEGCKDLKNYNIEDIPGLPFLRYLSIRDMSITELPDQNEQQVHGIQFSDSCYLNRVPKWFKSHQKLEYICIGIMEIENKDLELLSELPLLRHLSLSCKTMPAEMLVIKSIGFPVLKEFHLHSVTADLITFEPEAMKKLEILLIDQFMCLKKIDSSISGEGEGASQLLKAIRKSAHEHPRKPVANIIVPGNLSDYAVEGKEKGQEVEVMEVD